MYAMRTSRPLPSQPRPSLLIRLLFSLSPYADRLVVDRFRRLMLVVLILTSPARYFSKLCLGPRHDRLAPCEIAVAAVAVDGDPIASRNRCTCKLCPVGCKVDRHVAASDDAGLAHLARDERGMGGAGAHSGHDARCDSKARDVSRAGIGAHQDHRVARGRKPLGAFGIERGASHRHAA